MSDPPDSYPDDVQEAFEYCGDCDTMVVSVDQHTCSDGDDSSHKSATEREELGANDDRPLDETVLYPEGRSSNNAWAYHELDEDGDPLHEVTHRSGSTTGTRAEAIKAGCYPCGHCQAIQDRRDDERSD